MSGAVPVIIGFVALAVLTVGVVLYIVRSAIREVENRDSRQSANGDSNEGS